jgi:prepilin-type N-terminal cleavage/methylation domain-containing protein
VKKRAFTLIELITVMGVSAILLTLITIPVVQSFNLTRAAESFVSAQRSARLLIGQIEKEVAGAAYVRPNDGISGAILGFFPDRNNDLVATRLEYTKLDIFPPAKGDPSSRGPGGAYRDPDTGRLDPTLRSPKGDVNLPAAPGSVMVRYWLGLADPFKEYSNPYINLRRPGSPTPADPLVSWNVNYGVENLYVLYRAEVPVYIWDSAQRRMVPNQAFFEVVDGEPVLDDPSFFLWRVGDGIQKEQRVRQWQRAARVISESVRFDMVRPDYNLTTRVMNFDGTAPRIAPLVRFQPRRLTAEPTRAENAVGLNQETDNAAKVGSDTFTTELGGWSLADLSIWPSTKTSAFGPGDLSAGGLRSGQATNLRLNVNQGSSLVLLGTGSGAPVSLFDISAYQRALAFRRSANAPYPFTAGTGEFGGGPGSPSRTAPWNEAFVPVSIDPKGGRVMASFDIREVGSNNSASFTGIPYERRLPATTPNQVPGNWGGIHTGPDTPYNVDVNNGGPTSFGSLSINDFQAAHGGINRRFNWLVNAVPANLPTIANARDQFAKRFVYLPEAVQPGHPSPLDRRPTANGGSGWNRVQIVPNSEVVTGPDQRPGPNFGQQVRYTRTTRRPVGPNEYFINYVDQKEPDWSALGISGVSYDPADYNPSDFFSGIVQVQYRAGYIEFNSRLGEPIPVGNIYVAYRFQFTEPNDVIVVGYDSSKQIEINLTVQTYPNSAFPNPQQVTVKGVAAVRNFQR